MPGIRPLSFTRNLGGLDKAYKAIRAGYVSGVSVEDFQKKCGLSDSLAFLVIEFFLCTLVRSGKEYVLEDTLVNQSLLRDRFDKTLARLYFFALNLNIPGERLREEHRNAAALQNVVVRTHAYEGEGWNASRFEKDGSLDPFIARVGEFTSAHRKWVNNYWWMFHQCDFVVRPDGTVETFPDTWGLLALRLFFERYTAVNPNEDVDSLVSAAYTHEIYKLIGVPRTWLDARVEGAANMFLTEEFYVFEAGKESTEERKAAKKGVEAPPPGEEAKRREVKIGQLIRRGDNRKFLKDVYQGVCQISGVKLKLPGDWFTVDCAHIRPLGLPHNGPDDVKNMLSLSPTMHRLFDRRCILIEPESLSIKFLHGNDHPHLAKLLVKAPHTVSRDAIRYFNSKILGGY